MLFFIQISSELGPAAELLDFVKQHFDHELVKEYTPSTIEEMVFQGEFSYDGFTDLLEWAEQQTFTDITKNNFPNLFLYLPLDFEDPLTIISPEGEPTPQVTENCEEPEIVFELSELGLGVASSEYLQQALEEIASILPPELNFIKWAQDFNEWEYEDEVEEILSKKTELLEANQITAGMMNVLHLYYRAALLSQKHHAEIVIIPDL